MKNNVAFIGFGAMGYPMAGHLSSYGYPTKVYNRTLKKDQKENKPSNKKVILFGAATAVFVIGFSSPLHSSNNINGNRIKSTEYSLIDLRVI